MIFKITFVFNLLVYQNMQFIGNIASLFGIYTHNDIIINFVTTCLKV